MGILKSASGAARGSLADQWLEAFQCDGLLAPTLVQRGHRMRSERSSNNGSDDVISVGSLILVPDGASAIVTEMGDVIACYDTPGEHKFEGKKSGGVFGGGLSSLLHDVGERFAFGGDVTVVQRVYFVNTKECTGNAFLASAVPVRLYDCHTTLDMDALVTAGGVFSFRIKDPVLFYKNVCGNVAETYSSEPLTAQMRKEMISALAAALSAVCEQGVRPSELPQFTEAICERIAAAVNTTWSEERGIETVSVALDTLSVVPADREAVRQSQRTKMLTDPTMAAATLTAAAADAMTAAAQNPSGGAMGLAAFGLAAGGAPKLWHCVCGQYNTGRFCERCGKPALQNKA